MFRKPLFFALFLAIATAATAQNVVNEKVLIRSIAEEPLGITYGPDGAYWFAEFSGYRVGRIDPATFDVTEVAVPNQYSQLWDIVTGPDSNIWVTASGTSRIGRVIPKSTGSTYQDWPLPHSNSSPFAIINGPDGTIWFVEYAINRIANFNPFAPVNSNGNIAVIHESEWIDTAAQIYGLANGPDGNLYFTEATYGRIGQLSTNAVVLNKWTLPNTNCQPCRIVAGPDGALWFTEFNANTIGRITTNGVLTEFPIPHPSDLNFKPYGILAGNDGKIWFSEHGNSSVGNITTNGILTMFTTRTLGSAPTFLATGSPIAGQTNFDPNIFFGENYAPGLSNQFIGMIDTGLALNVSAQTNIVSTNGTNLSTALLTFTESVYPLTITAYWGDSSSDTLTIPRSSTGIYTNLYTNAAGTLIASNISTTNTIPQTFVVYGNHNYPAMGNFVAGVTLTDASNYFSLVQNIGVQLQPDPPPFFNGEQFLTGDIDYLQFPDNQVFGYYTLQYFPWVYSFDLGWEYFIDANDGQGGAYLYDSMSGHWFYTNPALYPYLYDFTLNAWLYYFDDNSPRWFYNTATSQYITDPL